MVADISTESAASHFFRALYPLADPQNSDPAASANVSGTNATAPLCAKRSKELFRFSASSMAFTSSTNVEFAASLVTRAAAPPRESTMDPESSASPASLCRTPRSP